MITISFVPSNIEMADWLLVDRIIRKNLSTDIQSEWVNGGYDALCPIVPEYFGMTRMYRNATDHVTFEFTDEQWVVFLLRWA